MSNIFGGYRHNKKSPFTPAKATVPCAYIFSLEFQTIETALSVFLCSCEQMLGVNVAEQMFSLRHQSVGLTNSGSAPVCFSASLPHGLIAVIDITMLAAMEGIRLKLSWFLSHSAQCSYSERNILLP